MLSEEELGRSYRAQLDAYRGRVTGQMATLYRETVDSGDLDGSFNRFVPDAVDLIEGGEAGASDLTEAYLSSVFDQRGMASPDFDVQTGTTHPGVPLSDALGPINGLIKQKIGEGVAVPDALRFGEYLATRTADNEVTGAVDRVLEQAEERATGWRGIVRSTACGPCRTNAGEHPFSVEMYRHPGCDCVRELVFGELAEPNAASPGVPVNETSRAFVEKRTSTLWDEIREAWADEYPTLADLRAAVEEKMRELTAEAGVRVRVRESALEEILEDGRFKTQFETGTSGGALSPDTRDTVENFYFGYDQDTPIQERPIYGYVAGQGDEWTANQYGDVVVQLRGDVRERTSVTFYDSLDAYRGAGTITGEGQELMPSPLNEPSWMSAMPWDPGQLAGDILSIRDLSELPAYAEAQIHGGLRVGDIDQVIFAGAEPSAEIKAALEKARIKWSWDPLFVAPRPTF